MIQRKNITKLLAFLFVVIFITCNTGIEKVAAFWNQDKNNNDRNAAITVQLMHCNHNDTHYKNGTHISSYEGDTIVKIFSVDPRINNDFSAGTATYDLNKYIYEYEMSYTEGSEIIVNSMIYTKYFYYSKNI